MSRHTWQQWARACVRDTRSPSLLAHSDLAALTGQDVRALDAIAACWELYALSDAVGQRAAIEAARTLLPAMQASTLRVARELIPRSLDWDDRDRVWALVVGAPDGKAVA